MIAENPTPAAEEEETTKQLLTSIAGSLGEIAISLSELSFHMEALNDRFELVTGTYSTSRGERGFVRVSNIE
jgi:hypothetical protein